MVSRVITMVSRVVKMVSYVVKWVFGVVKIESRAVQLAPRGSIISIKSQEDGDKLGQQLKAMLDEPGLLTGVANVLPMCCQCVG
jgi:hypothetical protein